MRGNCRPGNIDSAGGDALGVGGEEVSLRIHFASEAGEMVEERRVGGWWRRGDEEGEWGTLPGGAAAASGRAAHLRRSLALSEPGALQVLSSGLLRAWAACGQHRQVCPASTARSAPAAGCARASMEILTMSFRHVLHGGKGETAEPWACKPTPPGRARTHPVLPALSWGLETPLLTPVGRGRGRGAACIPLGTPGHPASHTPSAVGPLRCPDPLRSPEAAWSELRPPEVTSNQTP